MRQLVLSIYTYLKYKYIFSLNTFFSYFNRFSDIYQGF